MAALWRINWRQGDQEEVRDENTLFWKRGSGHEDKTVFLELPVMDGGFSDGNDFLQ